MAATTFSFSSPGGVARIKIETTQYFNFDVEMDSKPCWWSDVVENSISLSLNAADSACGQPPMNIISCHLLLHPLALAPATSFSRAFFCIVYGSRQNTAKILFIVNIIIVNGIVIATAISIATATGNINTTAQ